MAPEMGQKEEFAKVLMDWALCNCRDFLWRHGRTPYSILVAEFLLKRTTSTAAHRQYLAFLERYPDIEALAVADIHELEEVIRPIGLYKQRAKGLKEAAVFISKEYGGQIPASFEELLSIPHVGPYTAACIISFGFGLPAAAVDSNVQRVLSRVFKRYLGGHPSSKDVYKFACSLIPDKMHVLFNYALIDFGALVCTYRGCIGEGCPLKAVCDTFQATKPARGDCA